MHTSLYDVSPLDGSPAGLYTVHLALVVRLTRSGRRSRTTARRVRLVVLAASSDDARERALCWLAQTSAGPLGAVTFGTGLWDAAEVRLAGSPESTAVYVFANDSDVLVLSS